MTTLIASVHHPFIMKNLNIDGFLFKGPHRLDVDPLPAVPAVALIATESGEGIQILSVVQSENIQKEIAESSRRECWKKNGWNGVDIYIQANADESNREMIRNRIRDKRRESIKCEDFSAPSIV